MEAGEPRRRVLKFGGEALRDGAAVRHAAGIVRAEGGERPVVVVSAHAGVTASLEAAFDKALAGELLWDPLRIRHRTLLRQLDLPDPLLDRELRELRGTLVWVGRRCTSTPTTDPNAGPLAPLELRRMRDLVLSFGERLSARVFAAALRAADVDATPMDAHDLGLAADQRGLGPPEEARGALLAHLERVPGVPVITGFFALDREGHLATLGRNGSDLTASWLGAALDAEEVQLWKRVPGILSADPVLVPAARPIAELSWDEAEALARHGSGVLHPGTVAPARGARVPLRVRDLDRPDAPGTRIAGPCAGSLALAHRTGIAWLRVPLGEDRARELAALFEQLDAAGIEPYLAEVRATRVEVLVPECRALEAVARGLGGAVEARRGLATVALLGEDAHAPRELERRRLRAVELALARGGEAFGAEPELELCGGPRPAAERHPVVVLPAAALPELAPALHATYVGEG